MRDDGLVMDKVVPSAIKVLQSTTRTTTTSVLSRHCCAPIPSMGGPEMREESVGRALRTDGRTLPRSSGRIRSDDANVERAVDGGVERTERRGRWLASA